MKWVLQILLCFAVSRLGLKLVGAVITQRDAEIWLRQPDGSQLHLKGVDVSRPFFGGLQVRTPDGRATTYPNAALEGMTFSLGRILGRNGSRSWASSWRCWPRGC